MLYFPSADLDLDITRLVKAGASLESKPHVIFNHADETLGPAGEDEWQAFLRDPDGNLVGLIEHRDP